MGMRPAAGLASTLHPAGCRRAWMQARARRWDLDDSYCFISHFCSGTASRPGQWTGTRLILPPVLPARWQLDVPCGSADGPEVTTAPSTRSNLPMPNPHDYIQSSGYHILDGVSSSVLQSLVFRKRRRKASSGIPSFCRVPGDRRWFGDYFTTRLPGSSLHPDSAPPNSSSHNARESTVVRIPLRSAKHHFGVTRARGNRPYNEDHYQAGVIGIPPFAPSAAGHVEQTPSDQYDSVFYFGVFDGHGGEDCSKFLKENLHTYIEETSKRFNGESEDDGAVEARKSLQMNLIRAWKETVGGYFRRFKPDFGRPVGCGAAGDGSVEAALAYAFLRADLDFITKTPPWFAEGSDTVIKMEPKPDTPSTHFEGGSTASVVLVSTPNPQPFWHPKQSSTLVTAHLGDTRALLCRTSDGLAVPLTTNHHPSAPQEAQRLRRYATAFVLDSFGEERFGVLANTRAFGDVRQKRLGVSAEPDINRREIAPSEYSFLVLVSDGVSAVLGDQEIVDIVKECKTPEEAAGELVEFVDEVGEVGDNATAMVVRLGGWEKRAEGGEGWMGTKPLRAWKRDEALGRIGARRT